MAFDSKGLDDYIDVAQRIAEFRVKHPEGSLQPLNLAQPFEIRDLAGTGKDGKEVRGTFIIYTAAAYRSPDDQRPGIGCAYEVFPGRTPYTSGSELQNAETAAWGRAIVAALAADTRAGIASQQEVRNRQAERGQSAGDVFENSAPGPSRQPQQRLSGQRPADAAPEGSGGNAWLEGALKAAPGLASAEACDAMWRKLAEKVADETITRSDAAKVQALLTTRKAALKGAHGDGDPWITAFRDAADAVEAERLLTDLRDQAGRGEIDPARRTLVEQAAEELFPGITTSEKVAA